MKLNIKKTEYKHKEQRLNRFYSPIIEFLYLDLDFMISRGLLISNDGSHIILVEFYKELF